MKKIFSHSGAQNSGSFQGTIEFDAPLARHTFYQIGGPAQVLLMPKHRDDLIWIKQKIRESGLPYFILGWGSNILFSDDGFPGVVIRMKYLETQIHAVEEGTLELGASVGCSSLLRRASQDGFGGLAHLTGIPGSVGGMAAMNAGTHLGEYKDCAIQTEVFSLTDPSSDFKTVKHDQTHFSYRHNHFLKPDDLITRSWVRYQPTDPVLVRNQIDELYQRRKQTQPVDQPSCGSVFMNPKASGMHAWQVIDKLGLRGHRIGNAQISEKHSNFIVNLGQAKAADVKALISLVKTRAAHELGIQLQEEVKVLG